MDDANRFKIIEGRLVIACQYIGEMHPATHAICDACCASVFHFDSVLLLLLTFEFYRHSDVLNQFIVILPYNVT